MTAPVTPLSDKDWPPEISEMRDGFAGKLNVYRVMAHHPALLKAWAQLREHVVRKSALGPERSEVVILRTGIRLSAPYEWAHHVVRARLLGFDDARLRSLRGDPLDMSEEDALLATGVDELIQNKALSSTTRDQLRDTIGLEATFDLIATVGFYSVLGYILNSYDIPIDDDIRAALEASPLS